MKFTVKAKDKFAPHAEHDYEVTQNGTITSQAAAEAHVAKFHPYLNVIPATGDVLAKANAKATEFWAGRAPATQPQTEDAPEPKAEPADSTAEVVHPASLT